MSLLSFIDRIFPPAIAYAHCDLPCGEYDPEQARVEAESIRHICEKVAESTDDIFKQRALFIKEERAELVKKHLWILWTDYFKEEHVHQFPNLHDLFWHATKAAGESKKSFDLEVANDLIRRIDEIANIYQTTQRSKP